MRLGLDLPRISLTVSICCDFTLAAQSRQSTHVGGAANTSTSSFHHRALQECKWTLRDLQNIYAASKRC